MHILSFFFVFRCCYCFFLTLQLLPSFNNFKLNFNTNGLRVRKNNAYHKYILSYMQYFYSYSLAKHTQISLSHVIFFIVFFFVFVYLNYFYASYIWHENSHTRQSSQLSSTKRGHCRFVKIKWAKASSKSRWRFLFICFLICLSRSIIRPYLVQIESKKQDQPIFFCFISYFDCYSYSSSYSFFFCFVSRFVEERQVQEHNFSKST